MIRYIRTETPDSSSRKKKTQPAVLETRTETTDAYAMTLRASAEGTYEVIAIRDRYCAFAKPGRKVEGNKAIEWK